MTKHVLDRPERAPASGKTLSGHLSVAGRRPIFWCTAWIPLEGAQHDAELDDPAGVIATDDVDHVHLLRARLELEHRGITGQTCFV